MTAANKKTNEIRTKSEKELNDMLIELRREQMNLRFQGATGQLAATARITSVRKDIARVQTQLSALKKTSAAKK